MSEWTPEAIAAEKAREDRMIAAGECPWSGMTIRRCQRTICDCFLPEVEALRGEPK